LLDFLEALPLDRAFEVVVRPHVRRRTEQQNRYLWKCYQMILDVGGEAMGGWTKDDLHEFFLGEWGGWQTIEAFGRKRMKPIRRSSSLNKHEFSTYVQFIQRYMAENGVYLPDPDEYLAEATVTTAEKAA
ncbi:hypothetical protein, partial [Nitrospira sp. BLG_2]|uniref:hypothetical protein n=1 Tax=Nitrospira sp. BLG_2 TaxID=3397507 RepID=UPI003B9A7A6B